ncbi:MAG: hypothetical protein KatS3mg106_777 [Gemmataceae bacterium]|jgi:hypothetical protein|nr:MAG: hypothetical protein KatS3mg106_777 [Gemmataceae bacterium]
MSWPLAGVFGGARDESAYDETESGTIAGVISRV